MTGSVLSVGCFADSEEVKKAILDGDKLRNRVLYACYKIEGYATLPLKEKNKIYDRVKKAMEG